MSDWDLLSEEKKQKVIALIQKEYPEILLYFFDAVKPIMDALQPLFEIVATVCNQLWREITKYLTEEQIEEIINKFGV